jgi:L-amino acid N-acyltransferase YncA
MTIQPFRSDHWPRVRAIYAQGIATGNATFQTQVPSLEEWHGSHLHHSRLVALAEDDTVLGWAALMPALGGGVSVGVAEASVYVDHAARGMGVGRQLLDALILESERHGIWTLQSSLFDDSHTNLSIYAGAGFRTVGYREWIGQLHGVWRTTVLLERRSLEVGFPYSRPASFQPELNLAPKYVNA